MEFPFTDECVCLQVEQDGLGWLGIQGKKYQIWETCYQYKYKVDMGNPKINV